MLTENIGTSGELELTSAQQTELRRLGDMLRWAVIANTVLILFLTFGMVFPSRVPSGPAAMPAPYYDFSAKTSPLDIPKEPPAQRRVQVPLISARNLPLPSDMALPAKVNFTVGQPAAPIRPAEVEATLTARKRTT